MKKYVCSVCGHIYNPAVVEPESGIAPGTPSEAILGRGGRFVSS